MKIFDTEMNLYFISLNSLILIDLVLISIAMIFSIPPNIATDIQFFDFIVCLILIVDWIVNFYIASPKISYLKNVDNILGLIASIPFDVILPSIIPGISILRYLRLLKLIRIALMFNKFYSGVKIFFDKTNMHKILGGVVLTVLIFTLLLWLFGPSYGLFDDFYFVVVTLTTVGYGDVTPVTYNEKVLSLILILIGIFIFSTITAAISSFLTDRLLENDAKQKGACDKKMDIVLDELRRVSEENKKIMDEINTLKNQLNNRDG